MNHERADKDAPHDFPAWHYGPNGEEKIFHRASDVPAGWHDHPAKHKEPSKAKVQQEKAALNTGTAAQPGQGVGTTKTTGAGGTAAIAPGDFDDVDKGGHKWDPAFHAQTKSKTNDGYWRMKVGVKRPAPLPGFPKEDEPAEKAREAGAPLDL